MTCISNIKQQYIKQALEEKRKWQEKSHIDDGALAVHASEATDPNV
jgi:hypothetical protein